MIIMAEQVSGQCVALRVKYRVRNKSTWAVSSRTLSIGTQETRLQNSPGFGHG